MAPFLVVVSVFVVRYAALLIFINTSNGTVCAFAPYSLLSCRFMPLPRISRNLLRREMYTTMLLFVGNKPLVSNFTFAVRT